MVPQCYMEYLNATDAPLKKPLCERTRERLLSALNLPRRSCECSEVRKVETRSSQDDVINDKECNRHQDDQSLLTLRLDG
jgi:hypothetical protein